MPDVSRLGAAELTWDPVARAGVLRFVDEAGSAGGPEAEKLTADLERWVGPSREAFELLVDCTQIATVDAAWRQTWADFFTEHRDHAVLAWFNANPEVGLMITMFRKGTGVTGEVFEREEDAREYLAGHRA